MKKPFKILSGAMDGRALSRHYHIGIEGRSVALSG